jgi:2-keto-4-pentenoate hydratase/2-oxohepta-3-ene-1,7-dioic acid hydratase in catechol pathway
VVIDHTSWLQIGKCFPGSAIIGPWIAIEGFKDYLQVPFELFMDKSLKQRACGSEMRLQPEEAIQYIETFFPLVEGDVIFTGTPSGVGEIEPGQLGCLKWGEKLEYQVQF